MLLALMRRLILSLKSAIYHTGIYVLLKYLLWYVIPATHLRMILRTLGWNAKKKAILGTQMLEIQGICHGADIPLGYYSAQKKILLEENSTLKMHQTPPYMITGGYGSMTHYRKILTLSQVTKDSGMCC